MSLDIGDTRIFCVLSRSPYGLVLTVDVLATYGVARLCERGGGKSWKWGQVERRMREVGGALCADDLGAVGDEEAGGGCAP